MKYVIIICLAFLLQSPLWSQSAEQEIKSLLQQQQDSWNQGNIRQFMDGYHRSADLQFLGASGLTTGWQNTLDNYILRYPYRADMGTLRFELHEITKRTEDVCTVIGQYFLERPERGNLSGYFLLVVQKIQGKWKVVADSTH